MTNETRPYKSPHYAINQIGVRSYIDREAAFIDVI